MLSGCHGDEQQELGSYLGALVCNRKGVAAGVMDDCEIVDDVDDASHVVVGKENRRTIKVLLGIAAGKNFYFIFEISRKMDFK